MLPRRTIAWRPTAFLPPVFAPQRSRRGSSRAANPGGAIDGRLQHDPTPHPQVQAFEGLERNTLYTRKEWLRLQRFRIHHGPAVKTTISMAMSSQDIEDAPPRRKLRKFDTVDVDIKELGAAGEGVGKHEDGMMVFVEHSHPGSRVRAEVYRRKRNCTFAKIVEVLEPSVHTVPRTCIHYPICRGCRTQDLSYDVQCSEKQRQIENLFRHYVEKATVLPIVRSKSKFHYRNKMEFTYGVRRYHPSGPPSKEEKLKDEFLLGMNAPRMWDKVIEITECHLMPESGTPILNFCRERTEQMNLPAYDNYAHDGYFRNLVMRFATDQERREQVMVNFVTSPGPTPAPLVTLARDLTERFPSVVSVLHSVTDSRGGSTVAQAETVLHGQSYIEQYLRGMTFRLSSSSFFQPNPETAESLYEVIEKLAEVDKDTTVLDLFCGTGTIGLTLAKKCKKLYGVEVVPSAVSDAESNAKRNDVHNAEFFLRNLEFTSQHPRNADLPEADVVLLDPPRGGLHPKMIKWLKLRTPQRIVYASCNPPTQLRDVNWLCEEDCPYNLTHVQPVDQFPNTSHCENVVRLELKEDFVRPEGFV